MYSQYPVQGFVEPQGGGGPPTPTEAPTHRKPKTIPLEWSGGPFQAHKLVFCPQSPTHPQLGFGAHAVLSKVLSWHRS